MKNWHAIIWRELRHCDDPDYAEHLYLAVAADYFRWFKKIIYRWQARPYASDLEAALVMLGQIEWSGQHVWRRRLRRLERVKGENAPLERLIADLQNYHWFKRFLARHVLLYRGGEAVEALREVAQDGDSPVQETASWLLKSISVETTQRLGEDTERWVCSHCLARCRSYRSWQPALTYYGCRVCRRSWGLLAPDQQIMAVLDVKQPDRYQLHDGWLRVNWLVQQTMFDFERVEIIQATDKSVEHFAMQAGNDTDEERRARYGEMDCAILSSCHLSVNTVRVLDHIFGSVKAEN